MYQIRVDGWPTLGEDAIRKLRLNSPVGGWFPALQELDWCITSSNLPYANLFFSPHLKRIYLSAVQRSELLRNDRPAITSAISALPASALQLLSVDNDDQEAIWLHFGDSFSSVALHCGSSLKEFTCLAPMSEAAVNHLVQLPNLCTWHVKGPPPSYSTSHLSLIFPPLTKLTLGGDAVCGWLSLFGCLEHHVPSTQGLTPLSKLKESLESLNIEHFPDPIIDASFAAQIQIFQNLVCLSVGASCQKKSSQCAFKLDDDNVTKLAIALSQLEDLHLGDPCFNNTCTTTVTCLLSISIHCVKLQTLGIHFNTTSIVDDLKSISKDPKFQELSLLPRCAASTLYVYQMPLALNGPDLEIVVNGMINIFPSLEYCEGCDWIWGKLSERIRDINTPGMLLVSISFDFPFD